MEEVDSIILHFLRHLDMKIEEGVKNICDLSVETIVRAVSTCLCTINPILKVPKNLPHGISHRIEVATYIATLCKDLGYKNDVGYQTFLYHNEAELRQVFMFLIERLPNEGRQIESSEVPVIKKSLLMRDIGNKINEDLKTIWIPPSCTPNTVKIGDCALQDSWQSHQIPIDEDILLKQLSKIKYLRESTMETKHFKEKNSIQSKEIVDKKLQINKSLNELKETAIVLRQKMDMLDSEKNVIGVEYCQIQRSCERIDTDLKNVQNILSHIGISNDDIERTTNCNFLDRVQKDVCELHKKSEDLMYKNLSMKADIDKVKNVTNMLQTERNKCRITLTGLKENAKSMKNEYEKKNIIRNQLKENYGKISCGNKRAIYTKRILEIISNVDKQNTEIQKVLEDTRQLQKEINTLEGQLERCFSIADETLFKDAKKDDQAKKAYKLLALLHSECNTIVSLVNDTGSLARDIVDLEENIKTEKAKNTEDNLKKILNDITKMQQEH